MNEPQGMFFEHFYDISNFWVKTLSYLFFFLGELWLFRVPYTSPLPTGPYMARVLWAPHQSPLEEELSRFVGTYKRNDRAWPV